MAETATAPDQAQQSYFRATEHGITDGSNHHRNEAFVGSAAILAHFERTGGVDPITGRVLYAPTTEEDYVAQEQERRAAEQQDYAAARGGMEPLAETPEPPKPLVETQFGMRVNTGAAQEPSGGPIL